MEIITTKPSRGPEYSKPIKVQKAQPIDFVSSEEDDLEDEDEEDDYYDDEYDYDDEDEEYEDEDEDEEDVVEEAPVVSQAEDTVNPTDPYNQYLHHPSNLVNEHTAFVRAKGELQKHHHEKVTKMMKDWAQARQRVQETQATDPKAADKLNREITARFQKTYEALEQEGIAEKSQLVALHQQRIQAEFNEKKRYAMEHYMAALQKGDPQSANILKALKHYIKTEQKDRLHTVNHFEHLRDTAPAEAERIRQQTLDHLAIIDQRIQQAIQMLNRVPDFAKKIQLQIEAFMKTFHEIDVSIANLMAQEVEIPQEKSAPEQPVYQMPEDLQPETEEPQIVHVPLSQDKPVMTPLKYDDEVMEDEHTYIELNQPHIAHQHVDNFAAEAEFVKKQRMDPFTATKTGSTLGIAVGCIAVFVIIVVGIVVLRKRAQRVPVNHGFVEVDQVAASPEERHVANMQINGYENPTYKYFEMNGNA